MKSNNILLIKSKFPKSGQVKTRLGLELGFDIACNIYKSMLKDLVNLHKYQIYDLSICFPECDKIYENEIIDLFGSVNYLFLGEGLRGKNSAIWSSLKHYSNDYSKIISIYGDTPNIGNELIIKSFDLLDSFDIVIGPDYGDAYYLIGMNKPIDLFTTLSNERIPYLTKTIELINKFNLSYTFVDKRPDIDTIADIAIIDWKSSKWYLTKQILTDLQVIR